MPGCRRFRKQMLQYYYGELDERGRVHLEAHLKECRDCEAEWHNLSDDLKRMDLYSRAEPESHFWTGFWDLLSERFERENQSVIKRPAMGFLPAWILRPAAALALLLLGIFLGRILFRGDNAFQQAPAGSPASVTLTARTQNYLETSKIILLGLVNFDTATEDISSLNMPRQQEICSRLVAEGNTLKEELKTPAQRRLRELVTDLEVILMQIANLEAGEDLTAVEIARSGVDHRSILFKINLEEMKNQNTNSGENKKNLKGA